jgi:hypothetical protein
VSAPCPQIAAALPQPWPLVCLAALRVEK